MSFDKSEYGRHLNEVCLSFDIYQGIRMLKNIFFMQNTC